MEIDVAHVKRHYSIVDSEWENIQSGQLRIVKAINGQSGKTEILKWSSLDKSEIDTYCKNFNEVKRNPHNHVIEHRDIFIVTENSFPFSILEVLEYANGGTLVDFLRKGQKGIVVLRLFAEIFEGLSFLHDRGILHRDIKATNILLDDSQNKVSAKLNDLELLQTNSNFPKTTPEYLAPEVKYYTDYNIQAEIWAIGIMLYELFSGKFPFGSRLEGLSVEQIRENIQKIQVPQVNGLPYPFNNIINVAMVRDLSKRAKKIEDLKKLLPNHY